MDFAGHGHTENISLFVPQLEEARNYEYHITLDYESRMFQTVAYYWKYLGWLSHDAISLHGVRIPEMTINHRSSSLPDDILRSTSPFGSINQSMDPKRTYQDPSRIPVSTSQRIPVQPLSWRDVLLGTNTVTGQVFPILHFTPPKSLLETWWTRLWFFPYGEAILKSLPAYSIDRVLATTSNGRVWKS